MLKKILLKTDVKVLVGYVSARNFMISGFMLKSLTQFEFLFVYSKYKNGV